MQQLLVFIVCEYLWPFLLPWRGWEDSSILPALIKSVDYPAFASVQILSLGSTADDPLGAFSLLRVGMVPLQPLGSHPTSAIVLQLLSKFLASLFFATAEIIFLDCCKFARRLVLSSNDLGVVPLSLLPWLSQNPR